MKISWIFIVVHHVMFSVIPSGAIQISVNADGNPVAQGLQTLTMTNASPASSAASTGGATIVQYAQGPDGQQFYIPGKLHKSLLLHLLCSARSFFNHSITEYKMYPLPLFTTKHHKINIIDTIFFW